MLQLRGKHVYNQISNIVITTVIQKGISKPNLLKTAICRTLATKNSLKDAPIILDNKKKLAPVLYE